MSKSDLRNAFVIGAAVGALVQLVLSNFSAQLTEALGVSEGVLRVGAFVVFTVLAPSALGIAAFLGRFVPVLYQFAKFAAVGSLNSFVDLGIFNLETYLWGTLPGTVVFAIFKAISFLVGTTNSYFWNKYWTFGSQTSASIGEAAKFYTIAITGGFLNVGVATLVKTAAPAAVPANVWVNIVAPVVGIFAVLLWNFLGYKFLVFRKAPRALPDGPL